MNKCKKCGVNIKMYWCTKCDINSESDECDDCGIQTVIDETYHRTCTSNKNNITIYFCPKCNSTMDNLGNILICSQEDCGWNVNSIDKNTLDYHSRLDNCTPDCQDKTMPHTCNNKNKQKIN